MNKTDFLKYKLFIAKGIYDNLETFEYTITSIQNAIDKNLNLYLSVLETKDHEYIVYADNDLSRLHNLKDKIEDTTYDELSYLSFYHIPKLEEVLKLTTKVSLIINLKIHYKSKSIFDILDNYKGDVAILSNDPRLIRMINRERPDYIVGECLTKRKRLDLNSLISSYFIKTDFISYDINYYDKLKCQKIKSNKLIIGYLIDNQEKYDTYHDEFVSNIVDNYQNINM